MLRFFCIFLLLQGAVKAQTDLLPLSRLERIFSFGTRDTNYIKQMEKAYSVSVSSWLNSWVFYIDPPFISGNKNNINFAPNLIPQLSVGLGLKNIAINAGYNLPLSLTNPKLYGQTRFFDFGVSYYKGYFGAETNLSVFSGMYQSTGANEAITIRDDSHLNALFLNLFYVANYKRFSFRSAIKTQELQCKSAGSFIAMLHSGYRLIYADTPFVSDPTNSESLLNNTERFRQITLSVRPGYAYNFVFKQGVWFVTPALFVGGGFSNLLLGRTNQNATTLSEDVDVHAKIALGYNGPNYFCNAYASYDAALVQLQKNTSIAFNQSFIGVNIGYRFSRFIKKYPWL